MERLDDILEEYEFLIPAEELAVPDEATAARPDVPLSVEESKVVEALWNESLDIDALGREIGMQSHDLSGILLGLEMKRVIRTLPGRMVELAEDLKFMRNP